MNVATLSASAPSQTLPSATLQAPPRLYFFLLLPLFSLLLSLAVAWQQVALFTPYLPLYCLLAVSCMAKWNRLGWIGSLLGLLFSALFFFPALEGQEKWWQAGIFCSLALDLLICYFSLEQIQEVASFYDHQLSHSTTQQEQAAQQYKALLKTKEEEQKEFETEIERLKQEAELRRIERDTHLEQLEWTRTELEEFYAKKEQLLAEARSLRQYQEKEAPPPPAQLKEETLALQEHLLLLQGRAPKENSTLQRACALAEGQYLQLREQFHQKADLLSQTRQKLFQVEGELEVLEREEALQLGDVQGLDYEKVISFLAPQIESLEEEVERLEGLVSRLLKDNRRV